MCRKLSSSPFQTKGNANGMGLADVITRRLFEEIDVRTYANIITSCYLDGAPVPIPMANDVKRFKVKPSSVSSVDRNESSASKTPSALKPFPFRNRCSPEVEKHPDLCSWKIHGPSVFRKLEICRPCFEKYPGKLIYFQQNLPVFTSNSLASIRNN